MFTDIFVFAEDSLSRTREFKEDFVKASTISVKQLKPLFGLMETEETASTASLRIGKRLPRSHWDERSSFCSFIETAETASAVTLSPWKPNMSRMLSTRLC
jgi:hypothetical protein